MKKFLILIVSALIFLCLFGCSNNGSELNSKDADLIKHANETLNLYCCNYETLNPIFNNNDANLQMLRLIFESLVICNESQKASPELAESYSVSSDCLVWTVKLKKNIKWHDGSPFTSKDVKLTYEDIMSTGNSSVYYENLQNIDYINTNGDNEINFVLKTPQTNFINLLEIPIVKYHIGEEFKPVGTGPYILENADKKTIYLCVNGNWHKEKPNIKNIEVKILPDKETSVYAYDSKEIDIVSISDSSGFGEYTSNSSNVILDYPSNRFNFISFNTENEILSDIELRKAIAYSINKEKICSEVLLSHGSVATSCMNSEWWVYNPKTKHYDYDINNAISIIEKISEEKSLPSLEIMVNSENSNKIKTAEIIKSTLKDCGIDINIVSVDWDTFLQRVSSGNYQMYIGTVLYSAEINPKYVISNPSEKLMKLFNVLQYQTSDNNIKDIYYKIQDLIAEELQIIPLYFDVNAVMYNKRISGKHSPVNANIYYDIENLKLKA